MKLPERIKEVTIRGNLETGAYPPNGFLEFDEAALGNGDAFGLYWEFGKEQQEPIVCEIQHDEGVMVPCFSSLDKFLEWYELNGYSFGEEEIDDPDFFTMFMVSGNEFLRQNNPEAAVAEYEKAVQSFSEASEPWFKLSSQQQRIGQTFEAQKSLINSILSNWSIEFPSANAVRFLNRIKPVDELSLHPLIKNGTSLSLNFGGKKENNDYLVIRDIITELRETGDIRNSLKLEQNYGYMMRWETHSFQERYNFNYSDWKEKFVNDVERALGRKKLDKVR